MPDWRARIALRSRAFATWPGPSIESQRMVHCVSAGAVGVSFLSGWGEDFALVTAPGGPAFSMAGFIVECDWSGGGEFSPHDATPTVTNADAIQGCHFIRCLRIEGVGF